MLRDTVVKLCRGKLKELDDKVGETNVVNREILQFLAEPGSSGLTVPGKYGGGPEKMSLVSFCLVREELARTCPNAELIFTMQGLGAGPIVVGGNEEQKQKYLPPVASGKSIITFALTEPSGGTDAASILSQAETSGGSLPAEGKQDFHIHGPGCRCLLRLCQDRSDQRIERNYRVHRGKGFPRFCPRGAPGPGRRPPHRLPLL